MRIPRMNDLQVGCGVSQSSVAEAQPTRQLMQPVQAPPQQRRPRRAQCARATARAKSKRPGLHPKAAAVPKVQTVPTMSQA